MSTETETKLLPCPFCGSEAQFQKADDGAFDIVCEGEYCALVFGRRFRVDEMTEGWFPTRVEAAKAWNTRA